MELELESGRELSVSPGAGVLVLEGIPQLFQLFLFNGFSAGASWRSG